MGADDERDGTARYIYGVIPRIDKTDFGPIGIEANQVYTIAHEDICAVVHACPPKPYEGDEDAVKAWVVTHSDVVDAVWEQAGSVLPMSFDVIIKADGETSAEDNVRGWLAGEYETFKVKLDEFKDEVELGVQVLWDPAVIAQRVTEENEDIRQLAAEMASKSRGLAYFYQHKIAEAVKKEIEAKADENYRHYYEQLREHAEDIQVNKVKKHPDRQMIMNLSLLVKKDRVKVVGEVLGKIQSEDGVEVRFTGPWPPYTFATKIAAIESEAGK